MVRYSGFSPFNFDQAEYTNLLENKLNYEVREKIDIEMNTGYDFELEEFLLLEMLANFQINENWNIRLGTTYDINDEQFDDNLIVTNNYKGERLNHKLGLEYDLNNNELIEADSNLSYEIKGDWGWYLENNISYDFEEPVSERLEKANLSLKKRLHCREVQLSYDYLNNELIFTYSLDIFPGDDISLGRSDQEGFIFNFGLEDDLKSE